MPMQLRAGIEADSYCLKTFLDAIDLLALSGSYDVLLDGSVVPILIISLVLLEKGRQRLSRIVSEYLFENI